MRKRDIEEALDWCWRNRGRPPFDLPYPARDEIWLDVERVYQGEKERQDSLDWVDLLVMGIRAMERHPDVRGEWNASRSRHLLVDQVEDLTLKQLQFLELMVCPTGSLMVTADPNLAMGRDDPASTLELFRLTHRDMTRHNLRWNADVSTELMKVTLTLQHGAANGRGLWDYGQVCDGVNGGVPVLVEVEGTLREMYTHALDEAQRLADHGTPWEHMAILYRNGGIHRKLETQLMHRGIPHHVLGNVGGDKPGDARLVVATLTCLLNPMDLYSVRIAASPGHPNRERRLRSWVSRRLCGLAQESGTQLVEAAKRYLDDLDQEDADHHGLSWLVKVWDRLDRELRDPRCNPLDLMLLAQHRIREVQPPGLSLLEDPEVDDLLRLCAATPRMRGETPRMHLQRFLDRWSLGLDGRGPGLVQERGLTLSPIQAAKGLRWPVVFVLDVSDRTIPGKVGDYSDRLEQELRTFYTAVTRASQSLYLYCLADTGRGADVKPTRFLDPIIDLIERRRVGIREVWARGRVDGDESPGSGARHGRGLISTN